MRFRVIETDNTRTGSEGVAGAAPAHRSKLSFSRGKTPLVLDENLLSLKEPLEKKGFNVLVPRRGKTDADLITEDLPGRILVTNNPRDFVYSAALLDYSIIDTTLVTKDPEGLASMVARAWVDYSLKAEHPAFYLKLHDNGKHEISTDL
jgi:hypothetical protein